MKHAVKHELSPELARKAADKAFEAYAQEFSKYAPTARWSSETHCDVGFTVKGFSLKGELDLLPGAIEMDLDVPFVLRIFKGQALDAIEREVRKWIEKAKRGELD